MRRLIVCAIAITAIAVPAFANCTPKDGPKGSPTVCITRSGNSFIADPDEVHVGSGRKVTFKFKDGKGKLKIEFEAGTEVRDQKQNGPEFTAIGNAVPKKQPPKNYTITDEETGATADPTIIIEPIEGSQIIKGPRRRLKKE